MMKFIEKLKSYLDAIDWLPSYNIKESQRAKYVRICAQCNGSLELIVPRNRPSVQTIIDFIKSKKYWIQKHILENSITLENKRNLQRVLHIKVDNEIWHIAYIKHDITKLITDKNSKICAIYGYNNNPELARKKLFSWLKSHAREKLEPFLNNLALEMNLGYSKLNIRAQKTIWGSCNAKGNISLNFKLIFLERALCEYILVHELCHLKHLDHSTKFWKLVEKYIPDYRERIAKLKNISTYCL